MSSLAEKHHEKIDDDDATSARAVKAAKLATAPVCIMDGGMGHQLRRLGVEISGPIGSVERFLGVALANLEQEDLVRAAHDAYIEAGARVIITNSYATVPGIVGEDREKVELCVRRAGEIARACAARADDAVLVAGSIPPLRGSYRPDDVLPDDELAVEYAKIVPVISPYADVLCCETMSCAREAKAAAVAAAAAGKPVWVSWTLAEATDPPVLRSGESLKVQSGERALACARQRLDDSSSFRTARTRAGRGRRARGRSRSGRDRRRAHQLLGARGGRRGAAHATKAAARAHRPRRVRQRFRLGSRAARRVRRVRRVRLRFGQVPHAARDGRVSR